MSSARLGADLAAVARDARLADAGARAARVALVVPSINTCAEPELQRSAPREVTFHATRLALPTGSPEELVAMAGAAGSAAQLLAHLSPDIALFHCTAASTAVDETVVRGMIDGIEREVGCPVLTTADAVLDALAHLDARSVALITPYSPEVTDTEAAFLERHGVTVAASAALGLDPAEFPLVSARAWLAIARRVNLADADAIFMSCTNTRASDAVAAIEAELGRPVVTSNQATLWRILCALEVGAGPGASGELMGTLGVPGGRRTAA